MASPAQLPLPDLFRRIFPNAQRLAADALPDRWQTAGSRSVECNEVLLRHRWVQQLQTRFRFAVTLERIVPQVFRQHLCIHPVSGKSDKAEDSLTT